MTLNLAARETAAPLLRDTKSAARMTDLAASCRKPRDFDPADADPKDRNLSESFVLSHLVSSVERDPAYATSIRSLITELSTTLPWLPDPPDDSYWSVGDGPVGESLQEKSERMERERKSMGEHPYGSIIGSLALLEERKLVEVDDTLRLPERTVTVTELGRQVVKQWREALWIKVHVEDRELRDRYLTALQDGLKYDDVIGRVCVLVEDRVRRKAGLANEFIGIKLMEQAFDPQFGPLVMVSQHGGEQTGVMNSFKGVMGWVRNTTGHRIMDTFTENDVHRFIAWIDYLFKLIK
jgi:DNA-binding PadR family transcriptional regulator